MFVTEVKIKLAPRADDKLLAFASITIDRCFVVRDIKIVQGPRAIFIAMPSRKITDHCAACGTKNHLHAFFCNHCGLKLRRREKRQDETGRLKLHADIAHPINVRCRQAVHDAILKGYAEELERSRKPGYAPIGQDDLDAGPEYSDAGTLPFRGIPSVE